MTRLFFAIIISILILIGFYLLWVLNPLYAFITGITALVVFITSIGLIITYRKRREDAPTPPFETRRAVEIRGVRNDEMPEDDWVKDKHTDTTVRDVQWLERVFNESEQDTRELEPAYIDLDQLAKYDTNESPPELPDWLQEVTIPDTGSDMPKPDSDEVEDTGIRQTSDNGQQFDLMILLRDLNFEQQQRFFVLMSNLPISSQTEPALRRIRQRVLDEDTA